MIRWRVLYVTGTVMNGYGYGLGSVPGISTTALRRKIPRSGSYNGKLTVVVCLDNIRCRIEGAEAKQKCPMGAMDNNLAPRKTRPGAQLRKDLWVGTWISETDT